LNNVTNTATQISSIGLQARYVAIAAVADLTGAHSCSGRRGPWEAGPWRPPGLGDPGRL